MKLIIQFGGWCLYRLPTDPDPTDEKRGVSGYSFALAGEPDLDRVIRTQPPVNANEVIRSYSHAIGVSVQQAFQTGQEAHGSAVTVLSGAKVELLDDPMLVNRNWVLTKPGFEPIVPFDLRISTEAGLLIRRQDHLDPDDPRRPVWEIPDTLLLRRGAKGIVMERQTVGEATGIWDALHKAQNRRHNLARDLERETDPVKRAAIETRIRQLDIGLADPQDRRITAHYAIERFAFCMNGPAEIVDPHSQLGGHLDTSHKWPITYWMGAWDPDILSCYMQGILEIPYKS